jgi:hypothetical protein
MGKPKIVECGKLLGGKHDLKPLAPLSIVLHDASPTATETSAATPPF